MGQLSKALRFEVLARDGFRCRYCGAQAADARLQVDHVIPRFRGGKDVLANLVACCFDCNSGKSDRELKGLPQGFALGPDRRPARLKRIREIAAPPIDLHELDTGEIDELDELDDDSQLALVWCCTHRRYESHYIPLDLIGSGAIITRKILLRRDR